MKGKLNLRWFLIFSSVAVEIPRFAGMFLAADVATLDPWLSNLLHWGSVISGLFMGVLYAVGAMFLSHGLMKALQNKSLAETKKMMNLKFIALIFITGFIIYMAVALLTPYTVSRMTGQTLADTLGADAHGWAMLASIAPLLLMIGAFMSGSVSGFDGPQTETIRKDSGKKPETQRKENGNLPVSFDDFRQVPKTEYSYIAGASTSDICSRYGVTERTARNWRKSAQGKSPERL